jgi:hypothetical protein
LVLAQALKRIVRKYDFADVNKEIPVNCLWSIEMIVLLWACSKGSIILKENYIKAFGNANGSRGTFVLNSKCRTTRKCKKAYASGDA